jgi:hypothetical protein
VTLKDNQKSDVIVLTSLSSYWKSEEKLNELIKQCDDKLKHGGKVLFFNLSADHVKHLMTTGVYELKMGSVDFHLHDNFLTMKYDNITINENLVYLQDLTQRFKKYNIELKQFNRLSDDNLSSTDELLASMYCYGCYNKM